MPNTYEMQFNLSASVGGNFHGSFNAAQKALADTQKAMDAVKKTQGDVTSYNKLQAAIEKNNSRLEAYQKQFDAVQKEIKETGASSSALEIKKISLEQKISEATKKIKDESEALQEVEKKLRDAGINTGNLTEEEKRLAKESAELQKAHDAAGEAATKFGDRSARSFETAADALAAAGIVAGLKEIADGYIDCVKASMEFEAGMSGVEAISGASAEEMANLTAMAKEVGATTKFTAKQASDAMGYMAMAGWDAEEMLAGIPGVMNLAAASGEDLAAVSDIVTDSMTAFGLGADQTQRYADVLAQTSARANTNVGLMGETFKYCAPLAGALGYSVEDVAVGIGLMANAGIKGSAAGTSIRNILTRLADPTNETAEAMEALGVSLTDDSGKMRSFDELLRGLREGFAGLNEEQAAAYASAIASQRGMSGLLAIVNSSEEDFEKLTTEVNNCAGAAQKMADIKLDNLAGDVTILESAVDGLKITIGEEFNPELREGTQLVTGMVSGLNDWIVANPDMAKGIMTVVGTFGGLLGGLVAVTAATKAASFAFGLLGASIPGLNIILGIGAALGIVAGGVVYFNEQAEKTKKAQLDKMFGEISLSMEECQDIADRMVMTDSMRKAAAGFEQFESLKDSAKALEEYEKTFQKTNWILNAGLELSESEKDDYKAALTGYVADIQQFIRDEQVAVAIGVQMTMGDGEDAQNITGAFNAVMTGTSTQLSQLGEELAERVNDAFEDNFLDVDEAALIQETLEKIQRVKDAIAYGEKQAQISQIYAENGGLTYDSYSQIHEQSRGVIDSYAENAQGVFTDTLSKLYSAEKMAEDAWIEAGDEASKAAYDAAVKAREAYEKAGYKGLVDSAVVEQVQREFADLQSLGADTMKTLTDDLAAVREAKRQYGENSDEYKEAVKQLYDDQQGMTAAEKELFGDFVDYTEENLESLQSEYRRAVESGETATVESLQSIIDMMNALRGVSSTAVSNGSPSGFGFHIEYGQTDQYGLSSHAKTKTRSGRFASGTLEALPGWALVGENGPELVDFGGGETVYNHTRTNRLLSGVEPMPGSSPSVVISPVINIAGNADEAAVERMTDTLVDAVIEKLDEAGLDARRRAFA